MRKWKPFILRLPAYLLLLCIVGSGLWYCLKQITLPEQLQTALPTEPPPAQQGTPPEELVDKVIRIGDTFPVYDDTFTGHLECKITAARLITKQADCPPEWLYEYASLYVYSEEDSDYRYDQWFLPDGALDKGALLARVEMEISNVDAVAFVQMGDAADPANNRAFFFEPDYFAHNFLFHLTDLNELDQHGNSPWFYVEGHSEARKYAQEDDLETKGIEHLALKIPPGETIQVSMIFPISTKYGGTTRDPAYIFGFVLGKEIDEPYTYIDLNLEDAS